MDETDVRLLEIIQRNATLGAREIADTLGIDEGDCARRIKTLESDRVIIDRVTLLNPKKVGANVTVFVAITAPEHSEEWLDQFHKAVKGFPEVVEFYRMSGQVDYLLRIVVPDIESYDAFYKKLLRAAKLNDVSSSFAMEQIKYTTDLPVRVGGS